MNRKPPAPRTRGDASSAAEAPGIRGASATAGPSCRSARADYRDGIADPARSEELKAQAERLNPDTWVTDAEVQAGLENYESVFESLRSALDADGGRRTDDAGSTARAGCQDSRPTQPA